MNLHLDKSAFADAILASSDKLNILPIFIEKDYWITLVLKRLSQSKFNNNVVFKGGTSLSKGYRIIDRFSEDIDIAVITTPDGSGNEIKKMIRDVEKEISVDLTEVSDSPIASKGSRFRKTIFSFPKTGDVRYHQSIFSNLIIEINSFTNPYPYEVRDINSLISFSLALQNQGSLIKKYGLLPFSINILDKRQTLLEKLVSLFRFSFANNQIASLDAKIRHFYDLYFLYTDKDCRTFIDAPDFKNKLQEVWQHDQLVFAEPLNWQAKSFNESPLFQNFSELWNSLKTTYSKELAILSFSEIPQEIKIAKAFVYILSKLK